MKWEYSSADGYLTEQISQQTGLSRLLVRILINRGLTDTKSVNNFLSDTPILHDPFIMKDMDKAAERIAIALERREKIAVFGDYDADGITATALVYTFLSKIGADIIYELPERDDSGYGMNSDTVESFKSQGIKLVITVDTGITAFDEVELFNGCGIDVVITDHHQPREQLPNAYAVVDPHRPDCEYPFKNLAGVGVAFKLICALGDNLFVPKMLSEYSDLIALGSIADIVPVTDENRFYIREGLRKINNNPNKGIEALVNAAGYRGKQIGVSGVAYGLAPRINAAGRVSSPLRALDLLLSVNTAQAMNYADVLCRDNETRRELEATIFKHAVQEIEADDSILNRRIIVVSGENWHQGVIGIVAAKIAEKYEKPVLLLTNDGTVAQGSGRSSGGFNILKAIEYCADILMKFGGHEYAAGVQLNAELVGDFRDKINEYAENCGHEYSEKVLSVDCGISLNEVNLHLAKEISRLEPFGIGNQQPIFAVNNVEISAIQSVGKGKHLRINAYDSAYHCSVMFFGKERADFPFTEGDRVDIAFTVSTNVWQGRESVSVSAVDIRPSSVYLKADTSLSLYGNNVIPKEMLPTRSQCTYVYRLLDLNKVRCLDLYSFSSYLNKTAGNFNALKLRIIIDVFSELGIVSSSVSSTSVKLKINTLKTKVRLEDAPTSRIYNLFTE